MTFVYLAGYGLQFEGENYFVPIDANIRRDEDIPIEAFRISDFMRPLSGLPGTVKIVVIDAARQHPFAPAGLPLASGLALVDPDPGHGDRLQCHAGLDRARSRTAPTAPLASRSRR